MVQVVLNFGLFSTVMDEEREDVVVEESVVSPDYEIPASYLENPPPESLSNLDEQLTKVMFAY